MIATFAAALILVNGGTQAQPSDRELGQLQQPTNGAGSQSPSQSPQQQTPPAKPSTPPVGSVDQMTADEKKHQQDIEADKRLGDKYAADVDKQLKPSDDKDSTARVERIGKQLAIIANQIHSVATYGDTQMNKFDYTFKLVKGKDVNAFSLPGGHIYVYDGLVNYVESDDELAGVLAHEISHAKFRHIATIQKEASKLQKVTLPLVLLGVLAGGVGALIPALEVGGLVQQAEGSGWSVRAETAADFGGLQILEKSPYDATGMLTVMERLATDERYHPELKDLGIFRSHPPSRERADTLIQHMTEANIPLRRSRVTTSFRSTARTQPDGTIELLFGKKHLITFAGADAAARAQTAADRLNVFFDTSPEMFQVSVGADGWVYGKSKPLVKVTQDDAAAAKMPLLSLQAEAVQNIKRGLYTMDYKTWEGN